ncbi:MAG TPA: bifunctional YncE family protein/alkaline phosphatase family protein [Pyrinomonadaceae bacterium]|nr:bifunctional YncE family protein/alkaline phosphatase family protein [Pyrinomonadaceae bacterium]
MNPRIGIYLLLSLLLTTSLLLVSSSAVSDGPASEGRPITPAGSLVQDLTTRQAAVGALPVDLVRSPDKLGPGGAGRFLISVNSGYGIQFNAAGNRGQQSLSVIDLNAKPAAVVQNVYFPSPQSVNVGVAFSTAPQDDGSYALFVSGGFENKIWIFRFQAENQTPITPASPGPNTNVEAPFIDVSGFASAANSPRYNSDRAPVYPTGIAITPDGNTLFVANNLGDSLGVIEDVRGRRRLTRIDLRRDSDGEQFIYPYAVAVVPLQGSTVKAYVSCWNDASVAVVQAGKLVSRVAVGRHPTVMLLNPERTRLYVANSNDDSVSVIDTQSDKEIERINVRLSEGVPPGNSPEGLALRGDDLYVANAHSNSVAVVELSDGWSNRTNGNRTSQEEGLAPARSRVKGFIPTGQYPSALALVGQTLFIGNGKGTGVQNSSLIVDNSGRAPNAPNERFPAGSGRAGGQGGQYSAAIVVGNISAVNLSNDPALARYTQQVMRNNGLLGERQSRLFPARSPIKHVIYVIKENRTYDQILGDLKQSGDGTKADGDPSLAIFGAGDAAARPNGQRQDISPNHRALALRFGLFDRFFVNSEASPDGHNWSTAAFSTDYVDKAFRWNYSRRGRTYDYEGFNRLPNYEPLRGAPSLFGPRASTEDVANFMRRFIPYLQGSRDVAEPQSLYLWDAAARAGLTYRNYGEFLATLSEADVKAIRENRAKTYPDLTPTVSAFATKKSLEGHFNADYRNFDMDTPDAMTVDSYRAARESNGSPLIDKSHAEARFRGNSRLGVWLEEFRAFAAERSAGTADRLPNLSILRLSNDHTDGVSVRKPTPQFYVADNDYALGLMVEAVSNSPYWKDTAIVVVEDDAQDGPDHVDAHRSVALVISAYNKPGALVHEFHSTVSLIRTIELLLGIEPMNQLDATATPINIFRAEPDLRPYKVLLPNVALDNLVTPPPRDVATAYWIRLTEEQDLERADMADPEILNRILWYSVRGNIPMPSIVRLPAFDAMRLGLQEEREEIAEKVATKKHKDDDD